jgi:hypothetical protein
LKAQLQQALARVEAQEKMQDESLQPQTVEQVDELEKKLTDALSELKAHREAIKKRDAGKKS